MVPQPVAIPNEISACIDGIDRQVIDFVSLGMTEGADPPPDPESRAHIHQSKDCSKLLNFLVARDGIEPPTPAFSGLRSTN